MYETTFKQGPISIDKMSELYEKLPSDFQTNEETFSPDFSGFMYDGYFNLQGMLMPDKSKDNGKI